MIVPLVTETEWMDLLATVPAWRPPARPTLVIAPHPDDETLAAGGLIAFLRSQQVRISIVAVTDGEHAYADAEGLGAVREAEQAAALARLGVEAHDIYRLRLPDREVSAHEAQLVEQLETFITAGTHVIAPWPLDFHPDHEACGRAAARVAARTGALLTWYFFWTWHRGKPALLADLELRAFLLSAPELQAKTEALACHRSQLEHISGEPILPVDLLAPARRSFEVYLPA